MTIRQIIFLLGALIVYTTILDGLHLKYVAGMIMFCCGYVYRWLLDSANEQLDQPVETGEKSANNKSPL
jgi:Ca2+/Na+ antiporter